MSHIPSELLYTKSHEWVRKEEDGTVTVGVTDHAQNLLGDLVFVELPNVDTEVEQQQECCVLESVKAAADAYAPISGDIVAVNESLSSTPELINQDAYGEGWLMRIKPNDDSALSELLDAEAYETSINNEAH